MTSKSYRLFTIIFLVLLLYRYGYSQNLQFLRLNKVNTNISNQGASSDGSILKDHAGFIWIATNDGLNRWNGYDMKIYKPDRQDPNSILSPTLSCMEIAQDSVMWIGTANEGLIRYYPRTDAFDYIPYGSSKSQFLGKSINTLRCDSLGQMWVGTEYSGLSKFDPKTQTFIPYRLDNKNGTERIKRSIGGRTKPLVFLTSKGLYFPNIDSIKSNEGRLIPLSEIPTCIDYDADGNIWMGYADQKNKSIEIYNPITETKTNSTILKGEDIYKIHYDEKRTMWIASDEKLFQYDLTTGEFKVHDNDPADQFNVTIGPIQEIITEENGNLWYSTESLGAGYVSTLDTFIKQRNIDEILSSIDDPRGSQVSNFLIRKSNYKEVLGLDETIPEFESIERNWVYQVVSPVFWDTDDSFWFHDYKSLRLYRKQRHKPIEVFDVSHLGKIMVMDEDDQKRLWTTGRLAYYDLNNNKWEYPNLLLNGKGEDTIVSQSNTHLAILNNGSIALATHDNGVYIYNPKDTSLFHLKGEAFKSGGMSSNAIFYIYEQPSSSKLYLSSKSTINIWHPDSTFTYIDRPDDKAFKFLCITGDIDNNIWATNTRGIHYIKEDSLVGKYSIERLNRFDINAGSFTDKNGNVYNNHTHGPYQFSPTDIINSAKPSQVLISEIFIDRKIVHPIKNKDLINMAIGYKPNLDLNYNNNNIGFELGCLNAKLKEVTLYYQLAGYSDKWINLENQNTIHFTNLDPGKYVFRAKALSAGGNWSDDITEQPFTIRAPWYATWSAYLIYALIISSVLFGMYKYRINQLTRYQKLRTRISSDLHDDVGSLLSSLAWQTEVIGLSVDEETQMKFSKITDLSRNAMERMRDTVWAIDSRKDDLEGLIDRMTDYLADNFEQRELKYIFKHDGLNEKNKIAPDIRQNVYLIFKEAITNVLKHSNGNLVEIELSQHKKSLHLSIKDNGLINQDTIKTSGLGLSNMVLRAKRINADLTQTWENGCEINLRVNQISPL